MTYEVPSNSMGSWFFFENLLLLIPEASSVQDSLVDSVVVSEFQFSLLRGVPETPARLPLFGRVSHAGLQHSSLFGGKAQPSSDQPPAPLSGQEPGEGNPARLPGSIGPLRPEPAGTAPGAAPGRWESRFRGTGRGGGSARASVAQGAAQPVRHFRRAPLQHSARPAPSMAPRALPLLVLCSGLGLGLCAAGSSSATGEQLFKAWASQHRREYRSEEEFRHRLRIFLDNKQKVDKHNAGNSSFRMGLNQFADMTFPEFRQKYLWHEPQNCSATMGNFPRSSGPYPRAIDWRKKGKFVSPVKNQGPCGSCWTFSTTGCLESAIAIKTGKLLNLAEQQLIDCAQNFNNFGCNGGLPSQAFEYILYNKGLMDEEGYPYQAKNGTCKFQPQKAVAFIKDVVNISLYDEQGLVQAVGTYNPVSIAFEVKDDFVLYQEGVYTSTECDRTPDKVNHAVLAVGYGEADGVPFWIVKNSWGPSWGMDGYFNIERGKNMCGLADCASFPVPLL